MAQTMKHNSPIGSTLSSIAFISVGVITAIFLYDLWVGADEACNGGCGVDDGKAHFACNSLIQVVDSFKCATVCRVSERRDVLIE